MGNVIKQTVLFRDMGKMEYQQAWDYQEALLKENVAVKAVLRDLQAGKSQEMAGTGGQIEGTTPGISVATPSKDGTSPSAYGTSSSVYGTLPLKSSATASASVATTQNIPIHTPLPSKHRVQAGTHDPAVPIPDTKNHLLFVEHPPVYTLGKSGSIENILISEEDRIARGISFYNTNRGGDITFHGPEQIVGYPIIDLEKFYTDIGKYLRNLEEVIIATMAGYGLKGERSPGETGVWMDAAIPGKERKICAMGIRCSRWVTMHGFAFNVNTDLTYFDHIIPCGIQNKQVTSMERELGRKLNLEEVKEKLKVNFEKVFDVELISI